MRSGIIALNKPEGISSAKVVSRVKKKTGAGKVGHTGTLDPFATGLMLCTINKGTKISRFFLDGHKRYTATLFLGVETDTYDLTGQPVDSHNTTPLQSVTDRDIESAIASFSGIQDQIPPAYSALKHKGQPLYKLARQGWMIQKPPRQIEIFKISVKKIDLPCVEIDVSCSAGTYIRTLGYDIGKKLGCGAHLVKLCRTQSSQFELKDTCDLDALEQMDPESIDNKIIPLSDCIPFMPEVQAEGSLKDKIKFGRKLTKNEINAPWAEPGEFLRVTDRDNELLAIIKLNENRQEYNYSCVFLS